MISAGFIEKNGELVGFAISGHARYAEKDDIVCASVSSAAYMAANGITDVIGCKAYVNADEKGFLELRLLEDSFAAKKMISSLELHLRHLAKDYPKNLKVFFDTEV